MTTTDPNHIILDNAIHKLQDIIGTDAGGRGMKSLIVPGDLLQASTIFASLTSNSHMYSYFQDFHVVSMNRHQLKRTVLPVPLHWCVPHTSWDTR